MPENPDENILNVARLWYKKGDLIIKQGDFGLSIYKVLEGEVLIFSETEDLEIPLSTIGPGEVIGEMIFLDREIERRSASARAIKDTLLEVWHPKLLELEYEQMPPIIKYMADQTLDRLVKINRLVVKFHQEKNKRITDEQRKDPWAAKRRYYRKMVSIPFNFHPLHSKKTKEKILGTIKDISLGGAGLEVIPLGKVFPYRPGDEFVINTTLPNGKELELQAEVVSIRPGGSKDSVFLGVSFRNLSEHAAKNLGFFLMP